MSKFNIADVVRQAAGDKPLEVSGQIVQIPRDQITPNDANFYAMDKQGLEELASSIALTGLIHPIIVRPAEGGGYILVDGERRFRAMGLLEWPECPCIVRTPVNAVLEELMLIEANRTARKISSAELARQAERYEELLADLKRSGVEIPGRLRAAVAAAMEVSESKLARLRMIRTKLSPKFMPKFEAGTLSESVAYELAKLPEKRQALFERYDAKKLTAEKVEDQAAYAEECFSERECPYGGTCEHGATMFTVGKNKSWDRCIKKYAAGRDGCCKTCPDRDKCSSICPKAAPDVAEEKAKADAKNKREADRVAWERAKKVAAAEADWKRVGALREAAGIALDDKRLNAFMYDWKKYETRENLDKWEESRSLLDMFSSQRLNALADLLGASLDVLAGREPPAPGLVWHDGRAGDLPDEATSGALIAWGDSGLQTVPPGSYALAVTEFPGVYAWWARVEPPPESGPQPQPDAQVGDGDA